MGVLGQSRDEGASAVAPPVQGPVDKTGFFQNVGAGFRQAVAGPHSTRVGEAIYEQRTYDQIIKALQSEGEQGEDTLNITTVPTKVKRQFRNPYVSGPLTNLTNDAHNPLTDLYGGGDPAEKQQIWAAIQRVRQRKPDFFKQFVDESALSAWALGQRQKDVATAQAVTSRAGTAGTVGSFVGGMGGSVASMDPENMVGGGFGTAAGKTVARTLIKRSIEGAGANAAAALIGAPGQVADAQRLGQEMSSGDITHQVAEGAAIGAVFGGAHVILPKVPEAVGAVGRKAVDAAASIPPVRDALVARSVAAGTIKDHSLLNDWMRTHNPGGIVDTSTPEERAAAHVILRDAATKEVSPLHPEAAANNDTRLDAIAQSLGVDLDPPILPSSAPIQTPTVRDRSGPTPRRAATYEQAVHQAEGTGKNPDSTADGHFQFTEKTWLEYAPKVADTKGMSRAQILALRHDLPTATSAERIFRADNARYLRDRGLEDSPGNLSLAHFLGRHDAAKVLSAAADTPIERLVDPKSLASNRKVLEGKSASEVIAWAHKRIGASVDMPVARADAVPDADLLDEADYSDTPYERADLAPDEVPAAAEGVERIEADHWDPIQSGELLIFERSNGERVIVDGNKRAAMAQRLYADDPRIRLPAAILREVDGISEEMARAVGALKNVNLGNGTLEQRASALADMPEVADLLRAPEHHREIAAVARMPYEDFGRVLNGEAAPLERTNSLQRTASWVIREKKTGNVVMETFDPKHVEALNTKKYEAVPIGEYLGGINGREKSNAEAPRELVSTGDGDGRQAGEPSGETGGRDAAAASDQLLSERNEPSLYDHAVAAKDAAEPFSDPIGQAAKDQTALLDHDLLADATTEPPPPLFDVPETGFRLSDEGDAQPLHEIMREAEADELAAKALRDCLK